MQKDVSPELKEKVKRLATQRKTEIASGEVKITKYSNKHDFFKALKIDDKYVTTKGDNYPRSMDYEIDVPVSKIHGKIVWSWPRGHSNRSVYLS